MAVKKKVAVKPAPDLKSATAQALNNIADIVERTWDTVMLFGIPHERRTTRDEWGLFEEAKKLAVNYIRMGGKA
jgi:hypothetical protein